MDTDANFHMYKFIKKLCTTNLIAGNGPFSFFASVFVSIPEKIMRLSVLSDRRLGFPMFTLQFLVGMFIL